jgi:hypothetical protein
MHFSIPRFLKLRSSDKGTHLSVPKGGLRIVVRHPLDKELGQCDRPKARHSWLKNPFKHRKDNLVSYGKDKVELFETADDRQLTVHAPVTQSKSDGPGPLKLYGLVAKPKPDQPVMIHCNCLDEGRVSLIQPTSLGSRLWRFDHTTGELREVDPALFL